MEQRHRAIAKIALDVAGEHGFALAGGYAVTSHGMGNRPSGDIDIFTDWHRRSDFSAAVKAVTQALEQHGYTVHVPLDGDTFARLIISIGEMSETDKLEMSVDWQAHPPVVLEIGPVLHSDDAVANKMCALFGRAAARDFLDVDAAITLGHYGHRQLIELARNADSGFDEYWFAQALGPCPN